jgi:hypothetical protein
VAGVEFPECVSPVGECLSELMGARRPVSLPDGLGRIVRRGHFDVFGSMAAIIDIVIKSALARPLVRQMVAYDIDITHL